MGRLFWKLFLAFWLALLTVSAGVGGMVWLYQPDSSSEIDETRERKSSDRPQPDRPQPSIMKTGIAVLSYGGLDALLMMLEEPQVDNASSVLYVVGENGTDLLGRSVLASAVTTAEENAAAGTSNSARYMTLADGQRLLLFVSSKTARTRRGELASSQRLERRSGAPPNFGQPKRPLFLWFLNPPFWLLCATGLMASIFFSALLAWYLVAPVRHLRRVFAAAESGDLDARVQPLIGGRRDEIADLGCAYDRMADKLKELINVQKRLFHDVSHEIRSPLARLHVAIGLVRQNPASINIAVDRIELEIERLDSLVEEVLILARLESGAIGGKDDIVDLAELVEEIVEDASFEAEARGCRVEFQSSCASLFLNGKVELIARAFNNVIRNAIKYTAADSVIIVQTAFDSKLSQFTMSVTDQGMGVNEDELETIFEPFYRSRNVSERGGYGLGLAIAYGAIDVHGGNLKAANVSNGGLCVTITLPVIA